MLSYRQRNYRIPRNPLGDSFRDILESGCVENQRRQIAELKVAANWLFPDDNILFNGLVNGDGKMRWIRNFGMRYDRDGTGLDCPAWVIPLNANRNLPFCDVELYVLGVLSKSPGTVPQVGIRMRTRPNHKWIVSPVIENRDHLLVEIYSVANYLSTWERTEREHAEFNRQRTLTELGVSEELMGDRGPAIPMERSKCMFENVRTIKHMGPECTFNPPEHKSPYLTGEARVEFTTPFTGIPTTVVSPEEAGITVNVNRGLTLEQSRAVGNLMRSADKTTTLEQRLARLAIEDPVAHSVLTKLHDKLFADEYESRSAAGSLLPNPYTERTATLRDTEAHMAALFTRREKIMFGDIIVSTPSARGLEWFDGVKYYEQLKERMRASGTAYNLKDLIDSVPDLNLEEAYPKGPFVRSAMGELEAKISREIGEFEAKQKASEDDCGLREYIDDEETTPRAAYHSLLNHITLRASYGIPTPAIITNSYHFPFYCSGEYYGTPLDLVEAFVNRKFTGEVLLERLVDTDGSCRNVIEILEKATSGRVNPFAPIVEYSWVAEPGMQFGNRSPIKTDGMGKRYVEALVGSRWDDKHNYGIFVSMVRNDHSDNPAALLPRMFSEFGEYDWSAMLKFMAEYYGKGEVPGQDFHYEQNKETGSLDKVPGPDPLTYLYPHQPKPMPLTMSIRQGAGKTKSLDDEHLSIDDPELQETLSKYRLGETLPGWLLSECKHNDPLKAYIQTFLANLRKDEK